jgi:environmental stress-induced protein Ves
VKLHVVRCDQATPQRWRNGAGLTRELLAWPNAEHWQLRISVANIDADAPFSAFAGIDRWFAVVEGAGVVLSLPDRRQVVDSNSGPLQFAGEVAPDCALLDGATRDLNLMVRRDSGRATMRRVEPSLEISPSPGLHAVFTATAATLRVDGTDALHLQPFTLAWCTGDQARWRLAGDPPPRAWWIHFEAATHA